MITSQKMYRNIMKQAELERTQLEELVQASKENPGDDILAFEVDRCNDRIESLERLLSEYVVLNSLSGDTRVIPGWMGDESSVISSGVENEPSDNQFGRLVRSLRILQKMSQEDLALAVGVDQSMVSRVENPNIATTLDISKARSWLYHFNYDFGAIALPRTSHVCVGAANRLLVESAVACSLLSKGNELRCLLQVTDVARRVFGADTVTLHYAYPPTYELCHVIDRGVRFREQLYGTITSSSALAQIFDYLDTEGGGKHTAFCSDIDAESSRLAAMMRSSGFVRRESIKSALTCRMRFADDVHGMLCLSYRRAMPKVADKKVLRRIGVLVQQSFALMPTPQPKASVFPILADSRIKLDKCFRSLVSLLGSVGDKDIAVAFNSVRDLVREVYELADCEIKLIVDKSLCDILYGVDIKSIDGVPWLIVASNMSRGFGCELRKEAGDSTQSSTSTEIGLSSHIESKWIEIPLPIGQCDAYPAAVQISTDLGVLYNSSDTIRFVERVFTHVFAVLVRHATVDHEFADDFRSLQVFEPKNEGYEFHADVLALCLSNFLQRELKPKGLEVVGLAVWPSDRWRGKRIGSGKFVSSDFAQDDRDRLLKDLKRGNFVGGILSKVSSGFQPLVVTKAKTEHISYGEFTSECWSAVSDLSMLVPIAMPGDLSPVGVMFVICKSNSSERIFGREDFKSISAVCSLILSCYIELAAAAAGRESSDSAFRSIHALRQDG